MNIVIFAVSEPICFVAVVQTLENAGFRVIKCRDADDVVYNVVRNPDCVVIIEKALPTGKVLFSIEETDMGTRTGLVVASHLLKDMPTLPVALLTGERDEPDAPERVRVVHIRSMTLGSSLDLVKELFLMKAVESTSREKAYFKALVSAEENAVLLERSQFQG